MTANDSMFQVGQVVRYTTYSFGEAVYGKRGEIVNANWKPLATVSEGVVTYVGPECENGIEVVRCTPTTVCDRTMLCMPFQFYPSKLDETNSAIIIRKLNEAHSLPPFADPPSDAQTIKQLQIKLIQAAKRVDSLEQQIVADYAVLCRLHNSINNFGWEKRHGQQIDIINEASRAISDKYEDLLP